MAPPRPLGRGLDEMACGAGVPAALLRTSQSVQKPQQECWGKQFLTGSMELVVMAPSAGPGSGPSWRGGVATQNCTRMGGGASIVGSEGQAGASTVGSEGEVGASTVGSEGAGAGSEVVGWRPPECPYVGTEGEANHVVQPPHQHVAVLGVGRDGQLDTGEVTPTA